MNYKIKFFQAIFFKFVLFLFCTCEPKHSCLFFRVHEEQSCKQKVTYMDFSKCSAIQSCGVIVSNRNLKKKSILKPAVDGRTLPSKGNIEADKHVKNKTHLNK